MIGIIAGMAPGSARSQFDYRVASEAEILDLAAELPGLRLGEIPGARFEALEALHGKGEAGAAVEAFFGIPPNSISDADFPGAGIELKAVPVVAASSGLRVKERTVVSMIDYVRLATESWEKAHVRRKLHILFVFFEHLYGVPKRDFPILHVALWEPSGQVEVQIRKDWEKVHDKVLAGLATELTEADGLVLGPCRKGADSRSLRKQPFSDVMAKSRAFALKPSFTMALYRETTRARPDDQRLAEVANLEHLLSNFAAYEGRTVAAVGAEVGIPPSTAKDHPARVVRGAVLAASPVPDDELQETLTIKMSPVGRDSLPYEAMSFPAFRHEEIVGEDWQDSDMLARIEQMLIVPVARETRATPLSEGLIGRPVFWRPSADQLDVIEREWTTFRDLIRTGKADQLPTETQTVAVHVRPHGRDAADRDRTPGGGSQPRKSFWLNKRFVQGILQGILQDRG
jgi:DNA mismatch repair protein MutH